MKYTGYALIAMGMILFLFATGSSLFPKSSEIEEVAPWRFISGVSLAIAMGITSIFAGGAMILFGGRGFSRTRTIPSKDVVKTLTNPNPPSRS
jgi:hypothetical protein